MTGVQWEGRKVTRNFSIAYEEGSGLAGWSWSRTEVGDVLWWGYEPLCVAVVGVMLMSVYIVTFFFFFSSISNPARARGYCRESSFSVLV